jgi:hypothetical protein
MPCDIDAIWPQIKDRMMPWLQAVPGGVQDLLQEIRDGRSLCWRSPDVVLVLSLVPAPGGTRHLFIRAAASFRPGEDALETHMPLLCRLAADLGATEIRFRSLRAGWLRRLTSGWNIAHVEYCCEVR